MCLKLLENAKNKGAGCLEIFSKLIEVWESQDSLSFVEL